MRFTISEISSHFDLQFLWKIKVKFNDFWFDGIVLKFSFIIYCFPQFLSSVHRPIWSNSNRSSEISLIPCGFDLYLPLYPSIRDIFIKLVSLDLILTRDRVQLTTSWSPSANNYIHMLLNGCWMANLPEWDPSNLSWIDSKRSLKKILNANHGGVKTLVLSLINSSLFDSVITCDRDANHDDTFWNLAIQFWDGV